MAGRFRAGATLFAFGEGAGATDAQHVAVEFLHPVVVGKPALPALSLANDAATVTALARRVGVDRVFADQLATLAAPGDIALGITGAGESRAVSAGLDEAKRRGLLTVALTGTETGAGDTLDHVLAVDTSDPLVGKELQVTTYHVLWEVVHLLLDQPGTASDHAAGEAREDGALAGLYPFLYGQQGDAGELLASLTASTAEKADEIVALRVEVGERCCDDIATCANEMAARFADGGRLLTFGNGGSSTDAAEVASLAMAPPVGRPLPALGLANDVATVTALANDVGVEAIFSRQIATLGRRGDVAMALSTSGGSANVLAGLQESSRRGLLTVGLAGYDGGRMAEAGLLDHLFVVPSASIHRIQEAQTTVYHVLMELVWAALGRV